MLTTPIQKLACIIPRAQEYHSGVPPIDEASSSNPSDEAGLRRLAGPDNLVRQELADAINSF